MAGIKFDITGDNRNVLEAFNGVQRGVRQTQKVVEESGQSIEDVFKRIQSVSAMTFAGVSAKEFVSNVMRVRGEFQQLEVAFTTMLQSEEKAASLMNQLVKTAAITPFDLQGVANGAKQLLAYGIAADEVNDTLVRLGDIAAGLSIPLGDLVYLYGTTMVQGRMFTQDLRQFQGRGIPIADELAKQFGVAKNKVGELVTAGKVGAEQVKKAIMDMTQEGGRFGGLMEKQSKTITGQISNIEDAIDTMFNNIGKQNEGIINTALSGVSTLVENYEAVGKAIASAVAVYGVYKAAIMTVTAMQALQTAGVGALTVAETAHYGWIVLVEKAQKLLNATMLSNPYVLVATAIASVVAVMMNMKSQQERVTDALNEYNSKKDEAITKEEEHKRRIEELLSIAGDEKLSTENRRLALVRLEQQYPSIFKKYDTEAEKLKHILDIKNQIAELDGKKSLSNPANERKDVDRQIKDLENALNSRQTGRGEDKFVGEHTQNLMDRLKALRVRRSELDKTISKNNTDEYLANLTGISNDDLQKQINERRNLLAKMQTTEKKYGRVTSGGAKGTYSANELQGQLQILEAEQNKRNEAKYTPAQQKAMAKKALDEAKKALADFDKSTTKYTTAEAEEARKKLTDAVSEAEKEYKKFGGKTGGKKTDPAKTLKQEQRYTDLEAKLGRKASRDAIDLQFSTTQAEIDAMEEGNDKTLRQITLDFEKRKVEIERAYEDLKQKKIDEARQLWEANPANKDKVFDESTVDTSYTAAETDNLDKQLQANLAEYIRRMKEVSETEIQSMYDYLKQYGSVQSMKFAIAKEYDEKIDKEKDSWRKKSLAKEKQAAIDNLKAENLLNQIDLSTVFSDYGTLLAAPLEDAIEKLEQYTRTSAFKSRSIQDQKSVFEAIQNARQQLGGFSSISFSEIGRNLTDYNNALVSFNAASKELETAVDNTIKAEKELQEARAQLRKATTDEARATAKEAVNAALNKANGARGAQSAAESSFNTAQSRLAQTQHAASASLQNLQRSIDNVGNIAKAVASGSMKQLWDALGSRTQNAIGQFIAGTNKHDDAISAMIATLGKSGKGMDYLSERIQSLASEVIDAGGDIEGSGIGDKIKGLFSELFGKDNKGINDVASKLVKDIDNILNSSDKDDEKGEKTKKAIKDAVTESLNGSGGSLWSLIIGLILDLLDVLAEGLGNLVEGLLTKIGDAISGILSEIGSGKFFERIVTGIGNVIAGIVTGVGNLLTGGTLSASNEREMEERIAELAKANEGLSAAIDSLSERIKASDSTNKQSVEAYKNAVQGEKDWEANQRAAIDARASEYANSGYGFLGLGGKSSFNAHMADYDWYGWENFSKVLQQNGYNRIVNRGNIWSLSPEEMRLLRDFAPAEWASLMSGDGHRNPLDLVNEYIDRAGKIEELTSALNEKLTGYSWEGFLDSYKSLLKDMNSETKDFADKTEEMITNALLGDLVNNEFKERIKNLYRYIADAANDSLDENELNYIRQENERIANEMIARRQNLVDAGLLKPGDDFEQEASSKGFQAMGQDTGEELNGRFTALQIAGENISQQMMVAVATLNNIASFSQSSNMVVIEIRDMLIFTNSYLEDMVKYAKLLYTDFGEKLDDIVSNTGKM